MGESAANKSSKRRRKRKSEAEQDLSPDEIERRDRQRQLRELALKLRSQGKDYNPRKHKRSFLKGTDSNNTRLLDNHKPRRSNNIDVIILPIFWNNRQDEKDRVLASAAQVQSLLRAAGVHCDTDTTHKLTPGQKMRHWEERGVMIRCELGPIDSEQNVCVVAHCQEAGTVAKKRRVKIGAELVTAIGEELGRELKVSDDILKKVEDEKVGSGSVGKKSNKKTFNDDDSGDEKEAVVDDDVVVEKKKRGSEKKSGDDLDGDFDSDFLFGKETGGGVEEKKIRLKTKSSGDKSKKVVNFK